MRLHFFFFAGSNVGCNQRQRLQCVLKWVMWAQRIIFTASHIKGDCQTLYSASSSISPTTKSEQKSEKIHILRWNEHKQAMNNQVALSLSLPLILNANHTQTTREYIKSIWIIIKNLGAVFFVVYKKDPKLGELVVTQQKELKISPKIRTFIAHTYKRQLGNWQIVNRITWQNPMSIHLLSIVWYTLISIRHTKIEWYYLLFVSFFFILSSFLKGVAFMGF